ncbi:hypothetical protein [Franzmannia qiaohouensis]|uniref:Uncharacterized protein n=1 Tax=Franzmannia qiaohouensis TaxID=1329370 RepID=A0ABU1HBH2_9GAMM|nr:hypothetical protein [Halomonas qiaohouensis]MDR5904822.1 hypothetical protein [Halomonas qiaohouensis]
MRHKPWIPAAMALALSLGLTACGNGDDEPVVEDEPVEETNGAAPVDDDADDVAMPDTQDDEAVDEPDAAAPEEEPALGDDEPLASDEDPFEADAAEDLDTGETLGEGPGTLDDDTALPGETSDSDIDAFMEETERRFEEAQRQIEEQFEEVESQQPGSEAGDFEFDESQFDEPDVGDSPSQGAFDDEFSSPDTQN